MKSNSFNLGKGREMNPGAVSYYAVTNDFMEVFARQTSITDVFCFCITENELNTYLTQNNINEVNEKNYSIRFYFALVKEDDDNIQYITFIICIADLDGKNEKINSYKLLYENELQDILPDKAKESIMDYFNKIFILGKPQNSNDHISVYMPLSSIRQLAKANEDDNKNLSFIIYHGWGISPPNIKDNISINNINIYGHIPLITTSYDEINPFIINIPVRNQNDLKGKALDIGYPCPTSCGELVKHQDLIDAENQRQTPEVKNYHYYWTKYVKGSI